MGRVALLDIFANFCTVSLKRGCSYCPCPLQYIASVRVYKENQLHSDMPLKEKYFIVLQQLPLVILALQVPEIWSLLFSSLAFNSWTETIWDKTGLSISLLYFLDASTPSPNHVLLAEAPY